MRSRARIGLLSALAAAASPAGMAQSLFQRPVDPGLPPIPGAEGAEVGAAPSTVAPSPTPGDASEGPALRRNNPVAELNGVSLYAIQPSAPRRHKVHDQITIVVNQSSKINRNQALKTDKKYDDKIDLAAFPDLVDLFSLRVPPNGRKPAINPQLDLKTEGKFDGKGDYTREDRFTARITGTVIDVKPNGNLVIEARATTISDKEEQTMILSGSCRAEDVTAQNTVQSTQLADLRLETRNKGEIKDGSDKGILTKVFETLFNF